MIIAVVAYDINRGIGANNDLPWGRSLPADLANFKKMTTGKSIIMGRKTFESIGSRPLPNRQNIVLSSQATGVDDVLTAASLEAAYAIAQHPIAIIGGESIFKEALPKIDRIYATEVQAGFPEVDVYFPKLDALSWRETARVHYAADANNRYSFDLVTLDRLAA